MGQYWQYPYNQGIRPPFPGFYPGIQPAGYYPGMYPKPVRLPVGQDSYVRQTPTQPEPEKKQPWYVTVGKEALKIGAIVGASVLGGMFFGVPGALAAGAITSGAVSAIDQKVSKGKIDWGTVTIDTALGAIPGGAGSAVVKAGQRVLGKEILKHAVKKAAVVGSIDGALMGYAGGAAHTAYDSYKKTGELDLNHANSAGLSSILPGAIGGAIAGGAFTAIGNKISKKSSPKKFMTPEEFAHSQKQWESKPLADIPPPKRNLSNRIITKLRIRSQDPSMGIKNFHRVDDVVFRGAMPESPKAFKKLAASGFDTIIDLRGPRTTSPSEFAFETQWARQEKLKYHSIKMDSKNGPDAAGLHQLFWIIEDARKRGTKVYIHCRQGIERTGSMIGAYQMSPPKLSPKKVQLSPEQAYAAMQENGYAFFHKKAHKNFVFSEKTPALLDEVQESIALRIKAQNELSPEQYMVLRILWERGKFAEAASQMKAWQTGQSGRPTGTSGFKHHHRPDAPHSSLSFTSHNGSSHTSARTSGVREQSLHAEHLAPDHGTHHEPKTKARKSRTKSRTKDSLILPPPVSASDLGSSSFHAVPQSASVHPTSKVLHSSKHTPPTHSRRSKTHSQRPFVEPQVSTKPIHDSVSSASLTHGKSISKPPVQQSGRGSTVKQSATSAPHDVPVRPVEAIDRPIIRAHVEPPPFKPMFEGVDVTTVNFQQGNVQDCFLLSAINTVQHHKDGAKLLGRIGMRQLENGNYQVKFPGYDKEVTVKPASLEHPSLVQSETPQIRILEQAYKEMMYEKVRGGEPLTGQVLVRAMFGVDHATTLLAPFNDANRNTKTLLQTVFGETFDPHISQLDGEVLARQRIGEAAQQVQYFEDVHTLIQQKPQLRDAFNSIPIEGPANLQPGNRWLVTLPSGRKVMITDSSISDPTERALTRMAELDGGNFETIYKNVLDSEIRMAALKNQYSATFLDGAPVQNFLALGQNIWRLPGGKELIRGIQVMDTDAGLKVKFPGSPRAVLLEGQHIYESSAGRNLKLTIDQVPEESQAQVIMQAMQQFEIDERFNRIMDIGQSESALQNMFGANHLLPDNQRFLADAEIERLFRLSHPELSPDVAIAPIALVNFRRERHLYTPAELKSILLNERNHLLTAKVRDDLGDTVVLTDTRTKQPITLHGAATSSESATYALSRKGKQLIIKNTQSSHTDTVAIDNVVRPYVEQGVDYTLAQEGHNLVIQQGRDTTKVPIDMLVEKRTQPQLPKGHIYSVLQTHSNGTHITIADPFDTRGKRYTFPIDDFMRAFEVGGVAFEGV